MAQNCQLPDLSMRSQTFCYTADFLTNFFLYMPKTINCSHFIPKQPASTLEFQYFYSNLQYLWAQTKMGRAPFLRWHLQCLGRPMICGNSYVKHFAKFPDFSETLCLKPWTSCKFCYINILKTCWQFLVIVYFVSGFNLFR